jgi:hypothetical protein
LLTLGDAIKSDMLALIASPMQAGQVIAEAMKKREHEGYKFSLREVPQQASSGRPGSYGEEVTYRTTSTRRDSQPLSQRVRSVDERFRQLVEDPQAMADRQNEFLDDLKKRQVDIDAPCVEDPSNHRVLSIKDAVQMGLLDVLTGELVHSHSGRRYSVPRAVHMRLIQPDKATHIMESMNMSMDELNAVVQGMSSPTSSTYVKEVSWAGDAGNLRSGKESANVPARSDRRSGGPQSTEWQEHDDSLAQDFPTLAASTVKTTTHNRRTKW